MSTSKEEKAMKKNVIPRTFGHIIVKSLMPSNAGKSGTVFKIKKNEYGEYIGENLANGERWHMFPAHIRNAELYEFMEVA